MMNEIKDAITIIFKCNFNKDSLVRVFKNFIIVETQNPSFKNLSLKHDMKILGFDCHFDEIMKLSDVYMCLLGFHYREIKINEKWVKRVIEANKDSEELIGITELQREEYFNKELQK